MIKGDQYVGRDAEACYASQAYGSDSGLYDFRRIAGSCAADTKGR